MNAPRKFSLLSLVLLMTTLVAVFGWMGAVRQAQLARKEATLLRRQVESYRAEVGELGVADETRVHAVGLRKAPNELRTWKWRVFLPEEERSEWLLTAGEQSVVAIDSPGEHTIVAAVVQNGQQAWQLAISVDGERPTVVPLSGYSEEQSITTDSYVGPNDRRVWERLESPVLIDARVEDQSLFRLEIDRRTK